MPGRLRCNVVDLNKPATVKALLGALTSLARNKGNIFQFVIQNDYYFSIPAGAITSQAGWYVICDAQGRPIYVGTATNLNSRLNTKDGSLDNFANSQRSSDDARNFIKAFTSSGTISSLSVVVIAEPALCQQLGIQPPLSKLDRGNIEKVLSIFRATVV